VTANLERQLFMHHGMVAWMEAWSNCSGLFGGEVGRRRDERASSEGRDEVRVSFPEGLRADVVQLLAGMTSAVMRS
jgi:hypothetical protein